jgi:hypothetical protein
MGRGWGYRRKANQKAKRQRAKGKNVAEAGYDALARFAWKLVLYKT